MPYRFNFDLSRLPRFFFAELARISYEKGVPRLMLERLQHIIERFKIQEATGLNLSDAIVLLQDLVDLQAVNFMERKRFLQTKKRALLLPHCCRKFMDSRCKATFDAQVPSYVCAHCSPDCLVNKADALARRKGYDVYVLPGGSCVSKILKSTGYEGVVGVACGEEIRVSRVVVGNSEVAAQAVPLIKNGCANTVFNLETLAKTL